MVLLTNAQAPAAAATSNMMVTLRPDANVAAASMGGSGTARAS